MGSNYDKQGNLLFYKFKHKLINLQIFNYLNMAKSKKPKAEIKPKGKRANTYDPPLSVNGSFLDIMKAAGKDANNKSAKKK
jgi:hypothetical protein